LLGRHRDVASATDHTADGFAAFFVRKVESMRSDTAGLPPPPVLAVRSGNIVAGVVPAVHAG